MIDFIKQFFTKRRRDTVKARIEAEREHMHRKCGELVAHSQYSMRRTQIRRAIDMERRGGL